MGRNYLAGTHGDAANAVLAAAGYNFRRLLDWLALLLSTIMAALNAATSLDHPPKPALKRSSRTTQKAARTQAIQDLLTRRVALRSLDA
jgi:hypothetical protein